MNSCCSSGTNSGLYPKKYRCPVNGKEYAAVGMKTLLHHIKKPWETALKNQGYYFCTDPDCDVVYFGENNTTIEKSDVVTEVWEKELKDNRLVCYCFHVTDKQARKDNSIKKDIISKTKESLCSCETSNPSGRCCLKNFPKH